MNFVQASLIGTQLLAFVVAQYFGRYVHSSDGYRVILDVYKTLHVAFTFQTGSGSYVSKLYQVYAADSSYAIAFGNDGELKLLHDSTAALYPGVAVQEGDLTGFTYGGFNSLTSTFQGEEIEFTRFGLELIAGKFFYPDAGNAALMLRFEVEQDGGLLVEILCNREYFGTSLHLTRKVTSTGLVNYAVQSSGANSLKELQEWVGTNCPVESSSGDDFSTVTVATRTTIYTQLGGVHVPLSMRNGVRR
ncbi:hypothetical protein FOZ62_006789 [Perkinsus olseni]|uniref:Uncharacterized protein n=1 Tax=Perkinsus olseni TaxID=32597 RepID=A0A7J6Q6E3_PEROL|nr:hypothetical protein FOZ62_006789 [Perkinsus olseni]